MRRKSGGFGHGRFAEVFGLNAVAFLGRCRGRVNYWRWVTGAARCAEIQGTLIADGMEQEIAETTEWHELRDVVIAASFVKKTGVM
jgi:hypothetical protein